MTTAAPRRQFYWQRHTDGDGAWLAANDRPPGEDLAALRRGIGRPAGSVPQMWRYYTTLNERGDPSWALDAEHAALTLFAVHQQSQPKPAHRKGVGFGAAVRALRASGKFSEDAVDRRFAAAATATTLPEVAAHLRGLVTQLRGVSSVDYTALFHDLRGWRDQVSRAEVRRRWGSQYFVTAPVTPATANSTDSPTSAAEPVTQSIRL
jgi:CRISPR system Cascade subunit CasB